MASLVSFLEGRLQLKVNEAKSAVARRSTRQFLGYRLIPQGSGPPELGLSERSKKRLREKIREITRRNGGRSLRRTIVEVNAYLRGWLGQFGVCTRAIEEVMRNADARIRRRLRAVVLRHWKRKKTIAKRLIRLGISRKTAWRRVYAGKKSTWALSGDWATNRGLRNAYFASRGLVSLLETFRGIWARALAPKQMMLWDISGSWVAINVWESALRRVRCVLLSEVLLTNLGEELVWFAGHGAATTGGPFSSFDPAPLFDEASWVETTDCLRPREGTPACGKEEVVAEVPDWRVCRALLAGGLTNPALHLAKEAFELVGG